MQENWLSHFLCFYEILLEQVLHFWNFLVSYNSIHGSSGLNHSNEKSNIEPEWQNKTSRQFSSLSQWDSLLDEWDFLGSQKFDVLFEIGIVTNDLRLKNRFNNYKGCHCMKYFGATCNTCYNILHSYCQVLMQYTGHEMWIQLFYNLRSIVNYL